jgi:dihydroorotase
VIKISKKIGKIDPHVHCRDGKMQSYKGTIKRVFEIAEKQGVGTIVDMPNTNPPIVSERCVKKRLKLVPENHIGNYFLYVGLTSKEEQIKEAVGCYKKFKEVIGFKLYAGKSVGNLAVISIEDQKKIYDFLCDLGYEGVIAVHCEKEDLLRPDLWDPMSPISHSRARPKQAEIEAIKDQIVFIKEAGFKGTIHIVHVSCSESVKLIDKARKEGIKITCGVAPHHIMWNNERLARPDGLLYKMNPPLRSKEDVDELRVRLIEEKIDWVETDHAPHTILEKLYPPYLSGFPSLGLYKEFVEKFLPSIGASEELIRKMTSDNIYKVFKDKLKL